MSYYDTLQVGRNFDPWNLRRNYLTLAEKFHPRCHPTREFEALDAFKMLSESFDVLSNSMMRDIYDTRGTMGLNESLRSSMIPNPLSKYGGIPFGDFTFNDVGRSLYSLNRCESLLDETRKMFENMSKKLDKPMQMVDEDLGNFFKRWADNKNGIIKGSGYCKHITEKGNGEKVEITKYSTLNPDGTVEIKTCESKTDSKGHVETKESVEHKKLGDKVPQESIENKGSEKQEIMKDKGTDQRMSKDQSMSKGQSMSKEPMDIEKSQTKSTQGKSENMQFTSQEDKNYQEAPRATTGP